MFHLKIQNFKNLAALVWLFSTNSFGNNFHQAIISKGYSPTLWEEFSVRTKTPKQTSLKKYCHQLNTKFQQLKWQKNPCGEVPWKIHGYSHKGRPLIYWAFGQGEKVTLIISGVHPDEYTPIPMGFKLASYLFKNPKIINQNQYKVIIAALVNPDGFLIKRPTRVNGIGVDPNRNFNTKDWYHKALNSWGYRKNHSSRHFPGFFPNSEPETLIQTFLVDTFEPDKIVSIHAPLGFLDYDGPGDRIPKPKSPSDRKAKQLAHAISKKSNNYRVVDYSFFPGSLGNYAGNEKKIPTITLELMTTDHRKVGVYWQQFLPGILQAIEYPFERFGLVKKQKVSQ